jgi:hypothetical protein
MEDPGRHRPGRGHQGAEPGRDQPGHPLGIRLRVRVQPDHRPIQRQRHPEHSDVHVADSWHLSWSYWGCPDGTSNFQVTEYNSDGSIDINGISVNELGTGRGPVATYAYGDADTHYLSVNTEGCSWSLVPVTG